MDSPVWRPSRRRRTSPRTQAAASEGGFAVPSRGAAWRRPSDAGEQVRLDGGCWGQRCAALDVRWGEAACWGLHC